jgi:hypothetical protein
MFTIVDEDRTAEQIFARLTMVEKLRLRDANNMSRIEWLCRQEYTYDRATPETLAAAARMCGNKLV